MKAIRQLKKIPKHVLRGMAKVSKSSPENVNRIHSTLAMRFGNCHPNVETWVKEHGGSIVHGWMLTRISSLAKVGVWAWQFHSVWRDKAGSLLDITNQGKLHDAEKTIFIRDGLRKSDLINGYAYNNILVFSDAGFANHFSVSINQDIKIGEPFWATPDMTYLQPLYAHSGIYRLLNEEYESNHEALWQQYGIRIIGNKLSGASLIPAAVFLDFNLKHA